MLVGPGRSLGQEFARLELLGDGHLCGGVQMSLGEPADDAMAESLPGPHRDSGLDNQEACV
jgi:hypothetical protein